MLAQDRDAGLRDQTKHRQVTPDIAGTFRNVDLHHGRQHSYANAASESSNNHHNIMLRSSLEAYPNCEYTGDKGHRLSSWKSVGDPPMHMSESHANGRTGGDI